MTSITHPEITFVDATMFNIWVDKKGEDECWEWTRQINEGGYGQWWWSSAKVAIGAHRFSWMSVNGEIPEGMVIDHKCHNTKCVNPNHLHAVTPKQNLENYKPVRAKSGYRGVHRIGRKWRACVRHDYKAHYGPGRETPEQGTLMP